MQLVLFAISCSEVNTDQCDVYVKYDQRHKQTAFHVITTALALAVSRVQCTTPHITGYRQWSFHSQSVI